MDCGRIFVCLTFNSSYIFRLPKYIREEAKRKDEEKQVLLQEAKIEYN